MARKKIALITGVTGQDGSYLAELLLDKGYEVHGIKRRSSSFNTSRIDDLYEDPHFGNNNFFLHYGDMTDSSNLIKVVSDIRPDEIYNLAAQSHVQVSFETPEYTANADAIGTLRLLEAIRILGLEDQTKFYQASTSEMYGVASSILNEDSKFAPRSPYGVAKLYAHWITINYRESYGIHASNGILFNHESPRRGETFVTQKIVQGAVKIFRNQMLKLYLGNLESKRDWGHAKDYVYGMWQIVQHELPQDWVLATGETMTVREFAENTFSRLGIEIRWEGSGENEVGIDQKGRQLIEVDPKYFRPAEVPYLKGDSTKARELLGWQPKYTVEMLIAEMVDAQLRTT